MPSPPDKFDFTRFQTEIFPQWREQFRSGTEMGEYSFKSGGPTSSYGSADILILQYILGDVDSFTENDKDKWANTLNSFQDPQTGHYRRTETNHHQEHTTAFDVAALHLIDRRPQYPMRWKEGILQSQTSMENWIEGIDWKDIWASSHVIAGVPSALSLTNEGNPLFYQWFFDFLDRTADPTCGFWRRYLLLEDPTNKRKKNKPPIRSDLGGAFHLFFMYEKFQRQWRYPERVVDAVLKLQERSGLWGKGASSFIDLDALYSLFRSGRNAAGYRKEIIVQSAIRYLKTAEKILKNPKKVHLFYRNTHGLVGAIAAIAECQKFFPNLVVTPRPWKQSLDKACFI